MTQEEKRLLLKELSARLPYGVQVDYNGFSKRLSNITCVHLFNGSDTVQDVDAGTDFFGDGEDCLDICLIKPYLRPMSSMTAEENIEYQKRVKVIQDIDRTLHWCQTAESIDWLNEHHFDYRELIEKGLALEAPENMY